MTRYPRLDDYDRDPDASPQARQARNRASRAGSYAPGTGPYEAPLGSGDCWCGKHPAMHDWPGKADGEPHPREAS